MSLDMSVKELESNKELSNIELRPESSYLIGSVTGSSLLASFVMSLETTGSSNSAGDGDRDGSDTGVEEAASGGVGGTVLGEGETAGLGIDNNDCDRL